MADIALTWQWYQAVSLYICPDSFLAAKLSAGGVVETALAVMDPLKSTRNAFAIVRPPGHHAEPDDSMGFCFFNNVAIAAEVVRVKHPKAKVVIIDWCAASLWPASTLLLNPLFSSGMCITVRFATLPL